MHTAQSSSICCRKLNLRPFIFLSTSSSLFLATPTSSYSSPYSSSGASSRYATPSSAGPPSSSRFAPPSSSRFDPPSSAAPPQSAALRSRMPGSILDERGRRLGTLRPLDTPTGSTPSDADEVRRRRLAFLDKVEKQKNLEPEKEK